MNEKDLQDRLTKLSTEAGQLYLDNEVPVITQVPTSLEFLRKYVAPNKPVVIRNVFSHWPCMKKWSEAYLREKIGNKEVSVAVTPNGYADAVVGDRFVMPLEKFMTFSKFLDIMKCPESAKGIFYIQKQNSNLGLEFEELIEDVATDIPWATKAFGTKPDAVNFWMGDERAITSLHKDHYENLYCVISGEKTFILLPPTDQGCIPYEKFQASTYRENSSGDFEIVDEKETGEVPWIPLDPLDPDLEKYPLYKLAHPVTVTVRAGDMLYLPSLWFHHVRQSHACIAVNFWYDMQFDIKYAYYKFVESLLPHST